MILVSERLQESEAHGGSGRRLYCWLTSFSQSLQTNFRITLDGTTKFLALHCVAMHFNAPAEIKERCVKLIRTAGECCVLQHSPAVLVQALNKPTSLTNKKRLLAVTSFRFTIHPVQNCCGSRRKPIERRFDSTSHKRPRLTYAINY